MVFVDMCEKPYDEHESLPQSEQELPELVEVEDGHRVACHLAGDGREVPRIA